MPPGKLKDFETEGPSPAATIKAPQSQNGLTVAAYNPPPFPPFGERLF